MALFGGFLFIMCKTKETSVNAHLCDFLDEELFAEALTRALEKIERQNKEIEKLKERIRVLIVRSEEYNAMRRERDQKKNQDRIGKVFEWIDSENDLGFGNNEILLSELLKRCSEYFIRNGYGFVSSKDVSKAMSARGYIKKRIGYGVVFVIRK